MRQAGPVDRSRRRRRASHPSRMRKVDHHRFELPETHQPGGRRRRRSQGRTPRRCLQRAGSVRHRQTRVGSSGSARKTLARRGCRVPQSPCGDDRFRGPPVPDQCAKHRAVGPHPETWRLSEEHRSRTPHKVRAARPLSLR